MALTLGDNFSYGGSKPLDARLTYSTLADMKAVADSTMYNGCLAYCVATDKTYQWKSSNTVDTDTGRWREFQTGSSIEVDDEIDDTSENPVQNAVIAEALEEKQDADDIMSASDMDDVVTPLPSIMSRRFKYSTEEQIVGYWIDGKPIYQKVLEISISVQGAVWVDTNITIPNFNKPINAIGLSEDQTYPVAVFYDSNNLKVMHFRTGSSLNFKQIIVQYTKTTD